MTANGQRPDVLERGVRRLSQARILDIPARALIGAASRVLGPGPAKDALSGTGLGHPNHPWLTDLPIGFWTNAVFLDLFGGTRSRTAARRLVGAGILASVPTALTGLSDLTDVEDKEQRRIGMAHAMANTGALVVYALSYAARVRGRERAGRMWSRLGLALLTGAGYLGGHLSYRAGIGVDRTAFQSKVDEWTKALPDDELVDGQPRRVVVGDNEVMLVRLRERVYALANRCTHRGGPLYKGKIEGSCVVCPWHLSTFSFEDGAIVRGPATAPQPTYNVRVVDGIIEVRTRRPGSSPNGSTSTREATRAR